MSTSDLKLVLPKEGQIMIEDVPDLMLCKPRLIPLKSFTLEKLEKMQQNALDKARQDKASIAKDN